MVEEPTAASVVFGELGEKIEKVYCAVGQILSEMECSVLERRESQG